MPPAPGEGGDPGGHAFLGRSALGPLPPAYPTPALRFILRDVCAIVQVCGPLDGAGGPCEMPRCKA